MIPVPRFRFWVKRSVLEPTVVAPSVLHAAHVVGGGDVVVGVGVGLGVGLAVGLGVGVAVDVVPVCTTNDGGEAEVVLPALVVAVTATCSVLPTSPEVGVYDGPVAPAIAWHDAPALVQRRHW